MFLRWIERFLNEKSLKIRQILLYVRTGRAFGECLAIPLSLMKTDGILECLRAAVFGIHFWENQFTFTVFFVDEKGTPPVLVALYKSQYIWDLESGPPICQRQQGSVPCTRRVPPTGVLGVFGVLGVT
jgi:hypothetical protein